VKKLELYSVWDKSKDTRDEELGPDKTISCSQILGKSQGIWYPKWLKCRKKTSKKSD
jgi:hypothetical protein